MNISQLCQKYRVYVKEDITPAWEKHVNEVQDEKVWDYNAAMLVFLNHYFTVRAKKENELLGSEENAVNNLVAWINAYLKRNGEPVKISVKKKTRQNAAVAACSKLGWSLFADCPTDINITELPNGKFQCDICGNILFSSKAGEIAMKLLDKDRFTNDFLTLGYAAKCKNLNAYYRIGRNLAGADRSRANTIMSNLMDFDFPNHFVEVKNDDGSKTTHTLYPDTPLYWYYLGAEAGGDLSTYEAALGFRRQNIHTLCAKYMYSLTTYDNDHRFEAEVATLEALATHRIPNSMVSLTQRSLLLNRLVDKFAGNAFTNLSKSALRRLADHAYSIKKYRTALNYYQRAGIKSAKDTTDADLQDRIGNLLYDLGEKDAALEWLKQTYIRNSFRPTGTGKYAAAKMGDIYLQRWKNSRSASDAQNAAVYLGQCEPTPQAMATLLQMYTENAIKLNLPTLQAYARGSLPLLDAKTAGKLGYQFWESNKKGEAELPIALMRRAVDQDMNNGLYWYNLGMMVGYNTLYGDGFSAQALEMAEQYFETARNCGNVWATLHLSDCYWSPQKDQFPQDYQTARELLQGLLTHENPEVRHRAYMRLSGISKQEKRATDEIVSYLAKAHQANPKGNAVSRFHKFYGQWISGYVEVLKSEGTLQREIQRLFCGNAEFLYAIAMQQEMAGFYRCAILLYGCSAAMGSKKALCCLYNMSRSGTNYFTQKEVAK